jgi:hypothetical protein
MYQLVPLHRFRTNPFTGQDVRRQGRVTIGHTRSSPSTAGRSRTTQSPFLQKRRGSFDHRVRPAITRTTHESCASWCVCGIVFVAPSMTAPQALHCDVAIHTSSLPPVLTATASVVTATRTLPGASLVLARVHTPAIHKRVCYLLPPDSTRCATHGTRTELVSHIRSHLARTLLSAASTFLIIISQDLLLFLRDARSNSAPRLGSFHLRC